MAMDKKLKKAWLTALRSGKFRQAEGTLEERSNGRIKGNCCLGVLCRVAGIKPVITGSATHFDEEENWLSANLKKQFGVTQRMQEKLANLNDSTDDDGKFKNTFKTIATYIDKHIKIKAA